MNSIQSLTGIDKIREMFVSPTAWLMDTKRFLSYAEHVVCTKKGGKDLALSFPLYNPTKIRNEDWALRLYPEITVIRKVIFSIRLRKRKILCLWWSWLVAWALDIRLFTLSGVSDD